MMRPLVMMGVVMLGAIIVALFEVKYKVRDLRRDLVSIQQQIGQEQQAIHVLRAEWGYLNKPDRLQALNERYLHLQTIHSNQVVLSLSEASHEHQVAIATPEPEEDQ